MSQMTEVGVEAALLVAGEYKTFDHAAKSESSCGLSRHRLLICVYAGLFPGVFPGLSVHLAAGAGVEVLPGGLSSY